MAVTDKRILNLQFSPYEAYLTAQPVGNLDFVISIGQQLAWLSAACQFSNELCYADTSWMITDEDVEIRTCLVPIDEAEEKFCWHNLTGDTVIVSGFPMEDRGEQDIGLQIPLKIMAALGGISFGVNEGNGFSLQSRTAAFVPTSVTENRVQWHLHVLDTKDTDRCFQSFEHISLDERSLSNSISYLGWATDVLINAGVWRFIKHFSHQTLCPLPPVQRFVAKILLLLVNSNQMQALNSYNTEKLVGPEPNPSHQPTLHLPK